MTVRAIAGIAALSFFLVAIGGSILWALGAVRSWGGLLRLGGVAYLLGAAVLSVALTLVLVAGIAVNGASIVLVGVAVVAAALIVGRLRGVTRPLGSPVRLPTLTVFSALVVAAIVLYLEALFRAARLQPLTDWDTWWVWALRAKTIFHFGDLEVATFVPAGAGGAYPPGLSLLQAAAFHAMGSTDVVTLHLLAWGLAAAFVGALAGLLLPRARPAFVLPLLLLLLVTPSVTERILDGKADLPLGYLTAVGALLLLLWLDERQLWQLGAATLLLSGAMLTKREGLLLAACVFLAAFVASWSERRSCWPRIAAAAGIAFALSLPWRIWFSVEGLPSDAPPTGYLGFFDQLDRVWPSLRLIVDTLFDDDLWLVLPFVILAALVLAVSARSLRVTVFATTFLGAALLGSTWVIASNPEYEFTQDRGLSPVVRLVGDVMFVLVALTPLLLERAWSAEGSAATSAGAPSRRTLDWVPWALVATVALAYPASMLAGVSAFRLPGGAPSFPSAAECVEPPVEGRAVRVVIGYETTYAEAEALRGRARAVSREAQIAQDGCGRLRVYVDDVRSPEAGQELLAAAEARGLAPSLEADPDG